MVGLGIADADVKGAPKEPSRRPQAVRIVLINLDRDRDRLAAVDAALAVLGLAYERFPALGGLDLPEWLRQQFVGSDGQIQSLLHPGEIGCYASHLAIWRRIVQDETDQPVLVLEDDVEFAPGFLEVLANLERLPRDWDVVRCSNPPRSAFVEISPLTPAVDVVRYWYIPLNTAAYLINRAAARTLLMAAERRVRPVDHDMRRFWEIEMNTYGLVPPPVRQGKGVSAIDRVSGQARATTRKRFRMSASERRARFAAAVRLHGMNTAARCLLANALAYLLKRSGAPRQAARAFRVPLAPH